MYIRRTLKDKLTKDRLRTLTKLINLFLIIIALIIILPVLGIDPTGIVIAGGFLALVIGLATQSVIGNLIAGLFLMIEKPIKIGDNVNIEGVAGTVDDVRIISTSIRTFDGLYVRIPNETVFTNNITNLVENVARRFEYSIGIRYKDDATKAIEIIKNIIQNHPLALVNPEPQIFVDNLGDNSVNLIVRVWAPVNEWLNLKMELLWKLKTALEAEGIQIPFPQRELWFKDELKVKST